MAYCLDLKPQLRKLGISWFQPDCACVSSVCLVLGGFGFLLWPLPQSPHLRPSSKVTFPNYNSGSQSGASGAKNLHTDGNCIRLAFFPLITNSSKPEILSCPKNGIYHNPDANAGQNLPGHTRGSGVGPAHRRVLCVQKHILEKLECFQAEHDSQALSTSSCHSSSLKSHHVYIACMSLKGCETEIVKPGFYHPSILLTLFWFCCCCCCLIIACLFQREPIPPSSLTGGFPGAMRASLLTYLI